MQSANKNAMRKHSETIAFRADEDLLRLIDEYRKPLGISRGEWVRGIIISETVSGKRQLDLSPLASLAIGQEETAAAVRKLHGAMPRLLYVLLAQVAQVEGEAAKEIVRKVFPS